MRKSIWLLSAGFVALSMPAYAQETTDADAQPSEGVEAAAVDDNAARDTSEIVVTATRRNEALSDVPLAVSAVTAEALQNTGASDIRQMQQVSPSLLVTSTQSEAAIAGAASIVTSKMETTLLATFMIWTPYKSRKTKRAKGVKMGS